MGIERDSKIKFHELGTLQSVTKWITSHDEGLAEWLKNVRRGYQRDRADERKSMLRFRSVLAPSYQVILWSAS
jgi:hypothetical protein